MNHKDVPSGSSPAPWEADGIWEELGWTQEQYQEALDAYHAALEVLDDVQVDPVRIQGFRALYGWSRGEGTCENYLNRMHLWVARALEENKSKMPLDD